MTQPPLKLPDSGPKTDALPDGRLLAPSAVRNAEPIFDCIRAYVPDSGAALELASGTGQHIAALAQAYPDVTWLPSDASGERMKSVRAWRSHVDVGNLQAPMILDASGTWPELPALGLVYVANLFHLISEKDAQAVIRGGAAGLQAGGHFFIYGPFRSNGAFRSDGDAAFHASLVKQDSSIGYKNLEWVEVELSANGLKLVAVHQLPANNLAVVARKGGK